MNSTYFSTKRRLSIFLSIAALAAIIAFPAYADPVVKPTSGGTINVSFATDPANPNPGDQTQLKISFLKGTSVQQHIDYKVAVMEGTNQICGTQLLHTAEGSITIPCMLPDTAIYQVIVEVDGILFQPIPPETATFTITVGSPNSQVTNQTTTSNATGTIKIPSWVKTTAGWWSSGQVGDSDFLKGIEYLIQQKIMQIPSQQGQSSVTGQPIPSWIKHNAGWWANGQISDDEFVKGIQWLITNGIIVVSA